MTRLRQLFALDHRSLALFRVLLGAVLLSDLLLRATEIEAFYADTGVLPRAPLLQMFPAEWALSVHLASGAPFAQYLLFAVSALFALAFTAGYRTRLSTFISWALLVSLHNRNPLVLSSSDHLLRLLLFWSLFLPLGAAYSVDRALSPDEPGQARASSSVATAAFILQLCFVYWFTAALKSDPIWWGEGSALYYTFSIDFLTTTWARRLLAFPDLLWSLSVFSIWFEVVGPSLLFVPRATARVRIFVVFCFILFHAGMTLFLKLGTFPFVCIAAWCALLPGEFWERTGTLRRRLRARVDEWTARYGGPLGRLTARLRPARPSARTSAFASVAAAFFITYILFWNLGTVTGWMLTVPPQTRWLGTALRLDQHWGMFAPFPRKDDGWFVIAARLAGGAEVDLFRGGAPLDFRKPAAVSSLYPNAYWRKYTENLWSRDFANARLYYGQYLCRTWNAAHGGEDLLMTFEINYMLEGTPPPGAPAPAPQPVVIWRHRCF